MIFHIYEEDLYIVCVLLSRITYGLLFLSFQILFLRDMLHFIIRPELKGPVQDFKLTISLPELPKTIFCWAKLKDISTVAGFEPAIPRSEV